MGKAIVPKAPEMPQNSEVRLYPQWEVGRKKEGPTWRGSFEAERGPRGGAERLGSLEEARRTPGGGGPQRGQREPDGEMTNSMEEKRRNKV